MANNLKSLDAFQVLRSVYDVDKNCLRVCVVEGTTGGGGGFEVIISHTDDSIRLGDGSQLVTATLDGGKVGIDAYIINEVNVRDLDYTRDNLSIKDSAGDELAINADGSINVAFTPNLSNSGLQKYAEITSIATATETTIVSHTAVGGRRTFIQKAFASGDNIAKYRVKVNGTTIDMKRTMFGGNLNADFDFNGEINPGLEVFSGDVVIITVRHERSSTADFNGKIQYIEVV